MATLASVNNTLTEDGTFTLDIDAGRYYSLGVSGTWGGGSLAVSWTNDDGTGAAFPDSPITADGGFVFCAPAGAITLVLSGSTTPSLKVSYAPIS
jgi:hypothetical protein